MVIIFCFTSHKSYDYHSKFLASKDIHIDSINRLLLAQILTASTNNFSKKPWHVGPRCVFIGGPRWVPMFRSVLPPRLSQQCFNFQHPGVKVAEKSQLQQSLHRVGFKRLATGNHLKFLLSDVPMIFPWFPMMYLWNLPITCRSFPKKIQTCTRPRVLRRVFCFMDWLWRKSSSAWHFLGG